MHAGTRHKHNHAAQHTTATALHTLHCMPSTNVRFMHGTMHHHQAQHALQHHWLRAPAPLEGRQEAQLGHESPLPHLPQKTN